MSRYVVLEHTASSRTDGQTHWDLMLEAEGRLRTWALAAPPAAGARISAEALPDHRLAYLEYEGDVRGDRGQVRRWAQGTYRIDAESADEIWITFQGSGLEGAARLVRETAATADVTKATQRWTFSWDSA